MINSVHFAIGEHVVLEERLKALLDMGYEREVNAVEDPATFTHRGGIVDVFPWGFSFPIRIEFDDDEVISIKSFDPSSGAHLEPHKMVVILPCSERMSAKRLKKIDWHWGERPLQPFVDLNAGDYVVHVSHGIGIFRGIKDLDFPDEKAKQHLNIEYADQERLYVPLDDLNLVQRYISPGQSVGKIKLSKLGSKRWQKLCAKAQVGIMAYAEDLLALQAQRSMLPGLSTGPDDDWQKQLEDNFEFDETPDQLTAIADVKRDMEAHKPMDRLICGDVGYGKTEVAIRAIFKAIMSGRQAVMLAPTTLLAEQHYENIMARFAFCPMSIAMLSRFQTKREQKIIVEKILQGEVDFVVGTHRLLSKDISFKNLGLVVIDEEQRFGVLHKERLKKLRLMVDVLSMSATPIPRTLYMALVGGKDVSLVNTPPKKRVPIHTRVVNYDAKLIRDAVMREMKRKGQIFFVHNRVQGIEKIARELKALLPGVRIAVAHGQMESKVLERVMHAYIKHDYDLLIATTIIESGIDIPNANTIFINRADRFGLSDLYQLKGRVGRRTQEAYAYLILSQNADMTHDAQRRLNAIEKHTHLGSGFNIAMEDLEIRGAGNILGMQQSGFVGSIGFDLYCRLLKDAIESIQKKFPSTVSKT
ncbi:MAG: transcription-repair coupling factor (superfamily II helicase) [Candidatus Omnitrophota bacterium]|jgi:transcription-repair coupling factor (superfamily II helicase)